MRALLSVAVLIGMTSGAAVAQEASLRETRCWVGDVAFSSGLSINVGDGIAVCEAGSGWRHAEAEMSAAGCLLEGKLSSVGAVVGIRNNDGLLLQCEPNGRWVMVGAAPSEG
jgi:hypothetical protein